MEGGLKPTVSAARTVYGGRSGHVTRGAAGEEALASARGLHVLQRHPLSGRVRRAALEGRLVVVVVVVDARRRFNLCDKIELRGAHSGRLGGRTKREKRGEKKTAPTSALLVSDVTARRSLA